MPASSPSPFRIWDTARPGDARAWAAHWQAWPRREVHAHPAYVALYGRPPVRRPLCAAWCTPGVNILHPFLLRDLTAEPYCPSHLGPATDLISPYGYAGPFLWGDGDRQAATEAFWHQFDAWASQQGAVCEFLRFSLFPDQMASYTGTRTYRGDNIVRRLDLDEANLWADVKSKVRRNVRKARRNGVSVVFDPTGAQSDAFLRIYHATMDRLQAREAYYFSPAYFERLHQTLAGQFTYAFALHEGRPIAAELVLHAGVRAYFFLGGALASALPLRPNDLLKLEVMHWARRRGLRDYVLGGGYEGSNSLYRFKHSFAPNGVVPFYTGHRIFRPEAYETLTREKARLIGAEGQPWNPDPSFFPRYRA